MSDIDVSGAEGLEQTRQWLDRRGIRLHYSRAGVRMRERLRHFGLVEGSQFFGTNRAAIRELTGRGAVEHLDTG